MQAAVTDVWHNRRGESFHLRGWPASEAQTLVLVHHGLGEHAGRYDTLAASFDPSDPFAMWSFDARGHGRSCGTRGDADGLGQLAEDLETLIPVLLERSGATHVVLMGHSMGAAVTLWYLTTRDLHPAIRAVMLSAPPVAVERTPSVRVKLQLARVARRVAPTLVLASGLDCAGISSVAAEVDRYRADGQVHDRISARLGWSLLNDAPLLVDRARAITLPVLLWHGADDPIARVEGSRALAAQLPDVRYHEFAGARHEVHHERPEVRAEVVARIRAFVEETRAS